MACPTCDNAMSFIGETIDGPTRRAIWHCPRCGTLRVDGFGSFDAAPKLIEQCRKFVPDPSAFMESYREMRTALEPFAKFAETRERIPMRGLDDVIYQCHGGTEDEVSLRLSDCVRAHAALANADKLEGAKT